MKSKKRLSDKGRLAAEILQHLEFCCVCHTAFPSFNKETKCGECRNKKHPD